MDLKKFFIGALLIFVYLNLTRLFENILRILLSEFSLEKALMIHSIALIIFYVFAIILVVFFVRKRGNDFNVFYVKVLIVALFIFALKMGSNFLLGKITSEFYINNSSKMFRTEVQVKGIINTICFISLMIFFLKKRKIN